MAARVAAIEKWTAVADICRCLHNFNGVLQICAAFTSAPIFRLKKTWDKVPKNVSLTLNKILNSRYVKTILKINFPDQVDDHQTSSCCLLRREISSHAWSSPPMWPTVHSLPRNVFDRFVVYRRRNAWFYSRRVVELFKDANGELGIALWCSNFYFLHS